MPTYTVNETDRIFNLAATYAQKDGIALQAAVARAAIDYGRLKHSYQEGYEYSTASGMTAMRHGSEKYQLTMSADGALTIELIDQKAGFKG